VAVPNRAKTAIQGCAALALAGLFSAAPSQAPAPEQKPDYILREKVRLVIVPVTVKDRHGNLVEDLTQDDFRVFEDGRERPIQFFSNESVPLSAVILLDTGMPEISTAAVRSALRALGNSFAEGDEKAVYTFDNTIRPVQDFSSRPDLWSELAQKALPAGKGPSLIGGPLALPPTINGTPVDRPGTAPAVAPPVRKRIYDALYTAAQRLKTRPPDRRRVVVIVSDGMNGSDNQFSYSETMDALASSDVTVYAVSFGSGWATKRGDLLARVARGTGGDIAYVQRRSTLDRAFFALTNEARNSYVLGFPPASADGKFHEIQVRVKRPAVKSIARNRFFSLPE
jgi:VWFA-related protein